MLGAGEYVQAESTGSDADVTGEPVSGLITAARRKPRTKTLLLAKSASKWGGSGSGRRVTSKRSFQSESPAIAARSASAAPNEPKCFRKYRRRALNQ